MAIERIGLKEAGDRLGLTRNAVKARIAAGKLEGQKDNAGKWWVLLDPATVANDRPRHVIASETDTSNDSGNDIEKSVIFAALTAHIDTLKAERDALRVEVGRLQPRAELADKLQSQLDALQARFGDKAGEVEHLRAALSDATDERRKLVADLLEKTAGKVENLTAERPSLIARLLGALKR